MKTEICYLYMPICLACLCCLVGGTALGGCLSEAPATQPQVATVVATGANAALPILIAAYRQQGLDAIQKAPDRASANVQLAAVEAEWEPVWKVWKMLEVADVAWVKSIEAHGDTAAIEAVVKTAFCDLLKVWPKSVPAKPIVPLVCPGVSP
jgi:hypothetical protein